MFRFRTACLVTGWLFALLSLAVLLFAKAWVPQYIHAEQLWPLGVDSFRFIAALNFTVGALLLALSRGHVDALAQWWVALVMTVGIGVLAGVHLVVLAGNASGPGAGPRWTPALYADTIFFSLVALYWCAVTFLAGGSHRRPGEARG